MQLDRVVVPAGLFNPARVFSVVRETEGLYLIYTGRAMGNVQPRGGVAGAVAGTILDRMADKRSVEIAATEDRLRQSGAAAMKDSPHSHFFPRATIKRVTVKDGAFPVVIVEADKKLKLHFQGHDPATVRELFAPLLPS
jgi:hypothetical protein